MVTLYLKIEERSGIVSANFRAYLDGVLGEKEFDFSNEIIVAMKTAVKNSTFPESFRLEAEKVHQGLWDILFAEVERLEKAKEKTTSNKKPN